MGAITSPALSASEAAERRANDEVKNSSLSGSLRLAIVGERQAANAQRSTKSYTGGIGVE